MQSLPVLFPRWFISALLASALLSPTAHAADDPAARKVLGSVVQKNAAGFQTGQSKTAITLRLQNGKEKTWLTLARAARIDGKLKTRVTFLDPADDRGVELLLVEQSKGKTAQYLWLPKTRRLRSIGGSQKNAPFMGTDFSFGDLESHGLQAGEAKKLANEAIGGVACAHLDVTNNDPDDAYSHVELWIEEKLALPRQMKFYDKAGKLVKTLQVDEVQTVEGHATLKKFRMANHERGSVTTVETKETDTKAALPDALFQPDALGK